MNRPSGRISGRTNALGIGWRLGMGLGPIPSVIGSVTIDLHWWHCRCHLLLLLLLTLPLGVFIALNVCTMSEIWHVHWYLAHLHSVRKYSEVYFTPLTRTHAFQVDLMSPAFCFELCRIFFSKIFLWLTLMQPPPKDIPWTKIFPAHQPGQPANQSERQVILLYK